MLPSKKNQGFALQNTNRPAISFEMKVCKSKLSNLTPGFQLFHFSHHIPSGSQASSCSVNWSSIGGAMGTAEGTPLPWITLVMASVCSSGLNSTSGRHSFLQYSLHLKINKNAPLDEPFEISTCRMISMNYLFFSHFNSKNINLKIFGIEPNQNAWRDHISSRKSLIMSY